MLDKCERCGADTWPGSIHRCEPRKVAASELNMVLSTLTSEIEYLHIDLERILSELNDNRPTRVKVIAERSLRASKRFMEGLDR